MRELRNLALALNESERFAEALAICDRLEVECGDGPAAASHRAVIFLNTRKWTDALACARQSGGDLEPSAGFVDAFALHELGWGEDLLPAFLHAALNCPRAARMLMGERTPEPSSSSFTEVSRRRVVRKLTS
jgi:hypothetical protein